ncbi:hypothetical protein [Sphingomonas rustica]
MVLANRVGNYLVTAITSGPLANGWVAMSYINSEELLAQAAQLRSMASGDAAADLKLALTEMADRYERRGRAARQAGS